MSDPRKANIKAAKSGDAAQVGDLIRMDPDLLQARDTDGSTALHCAAWKGHPAVVDLLLRAGADVNAHNANDHWGTTPLHAAAHANQAAIAQLLLDHGADINAQDGSGRTPLQHTGFHNAKAAARLLQQHGAA